MFYNNAYECVYYNKGRYQMTGRQRDVCQKQLIVEARNKTKTDPLYQMPTANKVGMHG